MYLRRVFQAKITHTYQAGDEVVVICCHDTHLLSLFKYFVNVFSFAVQDQPVDTCGFDVLQQSPRDKGIEMVSLSAHDIHRQTRGEYFVT